MDLQDLYNLVDFLSKRGDQPGTAPQVTALRDIMKDTAKVADDYVGAGMGQAALRGPDALSRQIMLNAIGGLAGAGIGAGAAKATTKLTPKVEALLQWIKPRDIGVHLSPFDDLKTIQSGINKELGLRSSEKFPIVPNMTYKLSSTDINGKKMPARLLASSAEDYSGAFWPYDEQQFINAYVTKSKLGEIDPEILSKVGQKYVYNSQIYDNPTNYVATHGLNSRIVPEQNVIKGVKVNVPFENEGMFTEKQTKDLEKIIKSERAKELLRSMLRGGAVGSAVVAPAGVLVKKK
jgi:hypothetical protein